MAVLSNRLILYGEDKRTANKKFYYSKIPKTSWYVHHHFSNSSLVMTKIQEDEYEVIDGSLIIGSPVSDLIADSPTSTVAISSTNIQTDITSEVRIFYSIFRFLFGLTQLKDMI